MNDEHKTKEELISELDELRNRVAELESIVAGTGTEQQRLQNSDNHLSTLINVLPGRAVLLNAKGIYLDVLKYEDPGGNYQPEDVIGKSLYDVQNKEFADFCMAKIQEVLSSGTVHIFEYSLFNDQGELVFHEGHVAPLRDKNTGEVNVVWVSRNITKRKRTEIALRESEARLRTVVNTVPDRIVIFDAEGRYLDVVKRHVETGHYQVDNVIGKSLHEVQNKEFADFCMAIIQKTIESGQTQMLEYDLVNVIGQPLSFQGYISPLYDEESGETHVMWISRDITDRKQADLELARHRDHLETLVQERTSALEQEIAERKQLEVTKIRQERLAAIGQLAAGIAHDFNNVMAVITLDSSLVLRSSNLTDYERSKLERIQKQAQHAANLIEQILDFSRRSSREPVVLDLRILLSELIKFLQRTIPQDIEITFNYTKGDYYANVDPTQFQQMITNLAVNARDAIDGLGRLCFNLSLLYLADDSTLPLPEMAAGHWIQLDVRDTGQGIKPEDFSNVFEPFFTTKDVGKGTGLGLSQVHGIVHQHDGFITLESEVGKGTTFTIYLPSVRSGGLEIEQNNEIKLESGTGEVILLVEDNADLLESISDFLESLDYRVLTAKNGEEALAIFDANRQQISLVLSDVVMPQMDGIELVRHLKNYFPKPKIIMMSGFHKNVTITQDIEKAVVEWLQKPLDLLYLSDLVKQTLLDNN